MIGPSYHLFHLSNYHMFIKGINWLLSAILCRFNFLLYRNKNLYMKFMNKIDRMIEGMTEIQHSFMGTETLT